MAILKYNTGGGYAPLVNYNVQPITPLQTTGNSVTDIMSQDSVTKFLELKADADINQYIPFLEFMNGSNTASTTQLIPTTKHLCFVSLSANDTFSLETVPETGRDIHVIIQNSTTSDITIALPTNGEYINPGQTELTISGSGYGEINAISDGSNIFIRSI